MVRAKPHAPARKEGAPGRLPPVRGWERARRIFATDVFLRLSGWRIETDPHQAHAFPIELLEEGKADFEHLVGWLRACLARTDRVGK